MPEKLQLSDILRVRRHQPTRLEGFVDSAFAFAVTLLVISVGHVPSSVPEMLQALRGLPAFALSFLLLARLWKTHRDWSRHYDIEDNTAISLSLLLVFIVLVFVYPLRFIFSILFAWLTDNTMVEQPITNMQVSEFRMAFEIYGIGFVAIASIFILLHWHALRNAARIGLDAREELATRMNIGIWWALGGVAMLSVVLAATLPFGNGHQWLYSVPGTIYALMGIVAPAITRFYMRRIAALPAPP